MLLNHDVYFCIPKDKVNQYSQLCFLALNEVFLWVLSLEELSKVRKAGKKRLPVGIICDEIVALLSGMGGRLKELINVLRLARSVGCMVVLCVQSTSGLKCVYSDDEVDDILSNCAYRIFLDATTPATQKQISDSAGTFKEKKASYTNDGAKRTQTITFEEKPIVESSDLITLGGSDEAIMISTKTGYCRVKKVPYYADPHYKAMYDKAEELRLSSR